MLTVHYIDTNYKFVIINLKPSENRMGRLSGVCVILTLVCDFLCH